MKDYAILINSCDAYADLWPYFFHLLKLNWPEVEKHSIYLNTETISHFSTVLPIKLINTEISGKDLWGKRLINSLNQISEDYVVVLMDDFYLRDIVPIGRIEKCIDAFENYSDIAVFYLINTFKFNFADSAVADFGEVPQKTNFRLNSAPALWRKSKLIQYTKENDNPWAWEYFGSCRTNHTRDRFFCVANKDNPVYDYAHAIYRGKWLEKDIAPLIEKYHLDIDTSLRGIVKESDAAPKRSLSWKLQFLFTGIKMVGFDAITEVYRDVAAKKRSM